MLKLFVIVDAQSGRYIFLGADGFDDEVIVPIIPGYVGESAQSHIKRVAMYNPIYKMSPRDYLEGRYVKKGTLSEGSLIRQFFLAKTVTQLSMEGFNFKCDEKYILNFDTFCEHIRSDKTITVSYEEVHHGVVPVEYDSFFIVKSKNKYYNEALFLSQTHVTDASRFLTEEEALRCAFDLNFSRGFEIEEINYPTYLVSTWLDGELQGYGAVNYR